MTYVKGLYISRTLGWSSRRSRRQCRSPVVCQSRVADHLRDHMSWNSWDTAGCIYVDRKDSLDCTCTNIMVPLLDPVGFGGCSSGVPFVTGIELHGIDRGMWHDDSPASTVVKGLEKRVKDDVFYELRFVLHGRGVMRFEDGGEEVQESVEIAQGDAVLCKHGTVSFDACDLRYREISDVVDTLVPWGMATFVVYIPKKLLEEGKGSDGVHDVFEECTRFVRNAVWPGNPCAGNVSSLLSPHEMDIFKVLLCGAKIVESSLAVTDIIPSDDEDDRRPSIGQAAVGTMGEVDNTDTLTYIDDKNTDLHIGNQIQREYREQYAMDGGDFPALKKTLSDVSTFMLPNQTNRLALMFDPFANTPIPFVFGVEIFEPGHKTTPHVHSEAYEIFFILSGHGHGFCNTERFPVGPGDIVAFHPGSVHGIDNGQEQRMYCIEVMLPDEDFAEFVRRGSIDKLGDDDLCILTRIGCA